LFDATPGEVVAERPVEVIELLNPVVAGRDSGRSSGGAATEVLMLDQPPSMGDTVTALGRAAVAGAVFVGVAGQAGADDGLLVAVFVHGEETPPRAEFVVAAGFADAVNGFDDAEPVILLKPCSAARIPASTPSLTAVPVSLNAFCVRCATDGALGAAGWPYRS
jgi:hypothetical protein